MSMESSVDVVRGARLPLADGSLSAPTDLHLAQGRVAQVVASGGRRHEHATVLDAGGRIALPGLVDAHVHGGGAVFDEAVQHALLRQGITAIVTGSDGVGYAPSDAAANAWAQRYFEGIDGAHPWFRGGTLAELLGTYDGEVAVNVAALVPHGTLRFAVLGSERRPARPEEVVRMVELAHQAFADGAVGLSTGLEYVPAAWARSTELTALCQAAADHGRPHVSHMRGYEDVAGPAFAELTTLAHATGVATHVSHLHGPAEEITSMLDAARADGLDVTFDSYPYLRGCSILAMVVLPTWLPLADADATLAALDVPANHLRLRKHLQRLTDLWPRVTLAWAPGAGPAGEDLAGRALTDVAAEWGTTAPEAALRILRASRLRASCVFAQPPTNSAESVRRLAAHAAHLGGSDAIYQPLRGTGRPHPRGWGAFSRFLREHVTEHVTEDSRWSWHDAVEHLSARAARRFGLAGRGSLRPGAVADVVLVDPDAVTDRATYDAPRVLAEGIDDVLVAGRPVLRGGELTGATPGGGLRARTGRDLQVAASTGEMAP